MKRLVLLLLLLPLLCGCMYFARGPGGTPSPFEDGLGAGFSYLMTGNWLGAIAGFIGTSVASVYAVKKKLNEKKAKAKTKQEEAARQLAELRNRKIIGAVEKVITNPDIENAPILETLSDAMGNDRPLKDHIKGVRLSLSGISVPGLKHSTTERAG